LPLSSFILLPLLSSSSKSSFRHSASIFLLIVGRDLNIRLLDLHSACRTWDTNLLRLSIAIADIRARDELQGFASPGIIALDRVEAITWELHDLRVGAIEAISSTDTVFPASESTQFLLTRLNAMLDRIDLMNADVNDNLMPRCGPAIPANEGASELDMEEQLINLQRAGVRWSVRDQQQDHSEGIGQRAAPRAPEEPIPDDSQSWREDFKAPEMPQHFYDDVEWGEMGDIANLRTFMGEWHPFRSGTEVACLWLMLMYSIPRRAWEAIRVIVRQPWFNPLQMYTYKVVRAMRNRLPRLPMFLKTFRGTSEDASGVSHSWAETMPFFSIFHLLRIMLVLDNNIDRLDLGPTVGLYQTSELPNGEACRKSPLFTRPRLLTPCGRVSLADDVQYVGPNGEQRLGKVQCIFELDDREVDEAGFNTRQRRRPEQTLQQLRDRESEDPESAGIKFYFYIRPYASGPSPGELVVLWDVEDLIDPANIIGSVEVYGAPDATGDDWWCNSAILPHSGDVLPLSDLPLHPMDQFSYDFSRLEELPDHVPVLRLFLTYFYDDFGALRKMQHKVGGSYLGLGGLPRELQQLIRNIFVDRYVPPHVGHNEAVESLLYEITELEKGVLLDLGPTYGLVFVIGGIGTCHYYLPSSLFSSLCARRDMVE
jgi:hypothetical protein